MIWPAPRAAGGPTPRRAVGAVEQERGAGLGAVEHRHLLEQAELVAGDEVGVLDEVRRADRLGPEPQVRHGHRARLLRVVDEVALGEQVGVLADDLHRRLVGPDGAVGAEPEEHRLHLTGSAAVAERVVDVEAQPGDVVVDADREPPLRWRPPGASNRASSSKTALTWAGRNSFDDRP